MSQVSERDKETARLLIAGRLVRAVAHNLRQPLMALEMNLATILKLTKREELDRDQIADAIDDALLAGRRMATSLQALEDLAVPRRRRHEPMDVADIVFEIVKLVGANVKSSHVRIDADVEADLPSVVGDAAMVREAILSLTLAAVDQLAIASPQATHAPRNSPGHVVIEARRDDTDHVAVAVRHVASIECEPDLDEMSWDTAMAQAVVTLHSGSLSIETDARGGRATLRWPLGDEST